MKTPRKTAYPFFLHSQGPSVLNFLAFYFFAFLTATSTAAAPAAIMLALTLNSSSAFAAREEGDDGGGPGGELDLNGSHQKEQRCASSFSCRGDDQNTMGRFGNLFASQLNSNQFKEATSKSEEALDKLKERASVCCSNGSKCIPHSREEEGPTEQANSGINNGFKKLARETKARAVLTAQAAGRCQGYAETCQKQAESLQSKAQGKCSGTDCAQYERDADKTFGEIASTCKQLAAMAPRLDNSAAEMAGMKKKADEGAGKTGQNDPGGGKGGTPEGSPSGSPGGTGGGDPPDSAKGGRPTTADSGSGSGSPAALMGALGQLAQAMQQKQQQQQQQLPQMPAPQNPCATNPLMCQDIKQPVKFDSGHGVASLSHSAGNAGGKVDAGNGDRGPANDDLNLDQGKPGKPITVHPIQGGGGAGGLGGGGRGGPATLGGGGGGGGAANKAQSILLGDPTGAGAISQANSAMNMSTGAGGGGFSYTGNGQDPNKREKLNLAEFLPGGRNAPVARGIAAIGAPQGEFHASTTNIFSRITARFKIRCAQGLLRDCSIP